LTTYLFIYLSNIGDISVSPVARLRAGHAVNCDSTTNSFQTSTMAHPAFC